MGTIKLMPFVIIAMFAAVLILGARRSRSPELQQILSTADRDRRLKDLTRRLADNPAVVWSVRRRGIHQSLVMDLGDEEVDVRCFSNCITGAAHLLGHSAALSGRIAQQASVKTGPPRPGHVRTVPSQPCGS